MKKIVSIILAIILIASMSIAVYAEHINPNTGGLCNNTTYEPVHTGHNSANKAPHLLPSGFTCWKTYVNLQHKKRCAICTGLFSDPAYNKTCTIYHEICQDEINCFQ